MLHTLKLARSQPNPLLQFPLNSSFGQKTATVRLQQAKLGSTQPDHQVKKMDKKDQADKPSDKNGDIISHSFGVEYATRCDEDGFGGIYGGNQSIPPEKSGEVHENHPEYDKTQGSPVAEKEKARHQPSTNA